MDILKYHTNHETFIKYVLNGSINGKIHSCTCKHYTQSRKQVDILINRCGKKNMSPQLFTFLDMQYIIRNLDIICEWRLYSVSYLKKEVTNRLK